MMLHFYYKSFIISQCDLSRYTNVELKGQNHERD